MINKRSNNLCDVYILPLVNLNATNFGVGNFINSYVDTSDQYVVAKIRQINSVIKANPSYRFEFVRDEFVHAAFEIPISFKSVVKLFREGRYSQFSDEVKNIIRKRSGLMYKVPSANGKSITARELLVLDKDKALKKVMESELLVKIDEDAELGSIPGDDNFLELKLSAQLTC